MTSNSIRILRLWGCLLGGLLCAALLPAEESARKGEGAFTLPLGKEEVEFFVEGDPAAGGPLVVSLHRNENTAFPVVRELLSSQPGRFVGIRTPGGRRLSLKGGSRAFTIDPNRIFSRTGIEGDLRKFSFFSEEIASEIEGFAAAYLDKAGLKKGATVIAVHNNTDGGYSLTSYLKGGSESAAGAEVHRVEGLDADDFILVTNPRHFEALRQGGFNVVLQDNQRAPDDGSLSVYCGRQGIDYFNVEADFGSKAEQGRMLRAVFSLASGKSLPPAPPPSPSKGKSEGKPVGKPAAKPESKPVGKSSKGGPARPEAPPEEAKPSGFRLFKPLKRP